MLLVPAEQERNIRCESGHARGRSADRRRPCRQHRKWFARVRLRSTGTSFCYNMGRFAAAAGPFILGYLTKDVFNGYAEPICATPA
jgi:hypothetical protein